MEVEGIVLTLQDASPLPICQLSVLTSVGHAVLQLLMPPSIFDPCAKAPQLRLISRLAPLSYRSTLHAISLRVRLITILTNDIALLPRQFRRSSHPLSPNVPSTLRIVLQDGKAQGEEVEHIAW